MAPKGSYIVSVRDGKAQQDLLYDTFSSLFDVLMTLCRFVSEDTVARENILAKLERLETHENLMIGRSERLLAGHIVWVRRIE